MNRTVILSPEEVRVLGCLVEKSQATPEYYPMTLNALVAACNQKTSRDPVVEYGAEEVEEALRRLKEQGLCASVSGEGRVMKYAHRGGESGLGLSTAQLAALSLMLLRGPQTPGEIKSRSGRQHEFSSLEEVQETINSLLTREPPLAVPAPRQAGQKEIRYRHLFFESVEEEETEPAPAAGSLRAEVEELKQTTKTLLQENARLHERVDRLEEEITKLKKDLY